MISKKVIKLYLLSFLRQTGFFQLSRQLTKNSISIIGWHGVSLQDEHQRFSSLFISPETFRKRLEHLQKNYRVISLEEAVSQHDSGKIKDKQVVLTFDDAFYNFFKIAAPILEEFDMPATVYVVTDNLVNKKPFLPLVMRDSILLTGKKQASVTSVPGSEGVYPISSKTEKAVLIGKALVYYHSLPIDSKKREVLCRNFVTDIGMDYDAIRENRHWNCMNTEEIQLLVKRGLSMQVHSHWHRKASKIPADIFEDDTRHCRSIIEEITGLPALDYCYPAGFWCKKNWESLRRVGIRNATTVRNGPNFSQTPPLAFRRFLDGEDRTQIEFESCIAHVPWLLHRFLHRSPLYEPSEKYDFYKIEKRLY